jgi:hypothetical protein
VGGGVCDGVGVDFVAVGDGELEWARVGRMRRIGSAGALVEECRGFTTVTCGPGAGVSCDAGVRATPTPTRPAKAPAAALNVASTAVVRRCRPP